VGKYSVYSFDNPYLEEGDENKYSATVIMDEARERWRTGNWRAKRESFSLERSELTGRDADEEAGGGELIEKKPDPARPPASRFRLDIKKDLMGETISLKKLSELSYSPTYRPQGNLDEHLVTPMSTMQRYDVLAGDLESPPEDLSFLSDADSRMRRELEKSGEKKDGSLRRSSRRLERSLSERRAALISILPDTETAQARQIVRESQRRKQRMDAEIGRDTKAREKAEEEKKKNRRNIYAVPVRNPDDDIIDMRDLSVLRADRMPKQYGLDADRPDLPEFESETRHWSRITSDNPSWSEVQQHTEHLTPSDMEDEPESRRAHYVDDVEYDPEQPFRPVFGLEPRERLYSDEVGRFENEYNEKNGISSSRVQEIMEKEYRGRWIPPEYYADDRLVNAWFNDLSRGALEGEDFLDWAYRKRMEAAEARRMAEEQRRRSEAAMRARRQRSAPPPRPDRREDERRRYQQARDMGYRQGQQMAERDRRRDADHHQSRGRDYDRRQDSGRDRRDYESDRRRDTRSRSGYQGMYPDLFGADDRRPRYDAPRRDFDDYDDYDYTDRRRPYYDD